MKIEIEKQTDQGTTLGQWSGDVHAVRVELTHLGYDPDSLLIFSDSGRWASNTDTKGKFAGRKNNE